MQDNLRSRYYKVILSLLVDNDKQELLNKVDLSKQKLSNIKTGKQNVTQEQLINLKSAFPQVDMNWIFSGDGTWDLRDNNNTVNEAPATYVKKDELTKMLQALREDIKNIKSKDELL